MTIQYKIQTYKDEDGEFTEYSTGSEKEILDLINSDWSNEKYERLQTIVVKNEVGDILILKHHSKYIFDCYFLPSAVQHYYHAKNRIETIYKGLELFANSHYSQLEDLLNHKTTGQKFIRGDFIEKSHNYSLANRKNGWQLFWLVVGTLAFGGAFSVIGYKALSLPIGLYFIPILFFAIGTFLSLPSVLLYFQYKKDGQNINIKISKGCPEIEVYIRGSRLSLLKSDIKLVTQYENPAYKLPWAELTYTQILFKDGSIINLTNLLIDQTVVLEKFSSKITEIKKSIIPKLNAPTEIKKVANNR
ncbi:MAG: hypothetical protein RH948_19390 [Cyclobacteriaceae bacterium]